MLLISDHVENNLSKTIYILIESHQGKCKSKLPADLKRNVESKYMKYNVLITTLLMPLGGFFTFWIELDQIDPIYSLS